MSRLRLNPLATSALFGLVAQLLFYGQLPGVNVVLAVVALLLVLAATGPGRGMRRRERALPAAAVVLAALCAVRTDAPLIALDLAGIAGLTAARVLVRAGLAVADLPLLRGARELGSVIATIAVGAWVLVPEERARVRAGGTPAFGRAWSYAIGALIATPFLGAFAFLFASADAVFSRSLDDLVRNGPAEVPGRLLLGLVAAWVAGGAIVRTRRSSPPVSPEPRPAFLQLEPATAMLVLVDALFAVFVGLQLAYLFGGRDTIDAAGIAYSDYARRGFFELIAAGALVAAVLVGLELVVHRRARAFVALAIALVGLTALVLSSAAYRLALYQEAYGWTEQRLYAGAVLAFLALALVVLAWGLVRGRTLYVGAPLAAAALLVVVGLNALGPSAFVARANTDRALDPARLPEDASRTFDVRYLVSLGDGAIPTLVERSDALPEADRGTTLALLSTVAARRDLAHGAGWQGWNVDRERARLALATLPHAAGAGRAQLH